jgi:DNA-binding LytR/AlgR family response regulator
MITITVDDETFAMRCTVTFLSKDYSLIRLRRGDILYFEYFDRKIRIVTQDSDYICINEQIGDIARRMKPYGFSMCHQSFVVNLYAIAGIGRQELMMKNGDTVYLAQKRASTIRKELRSQRGKILI